MDKIPQSVIRLVRRQKDQQIVNIPRDVAAHLNIKPGDGISFELIEGGFVAMSKVNQKSILSAIGKKV